MVLKSQLWCWIMQYTKYIFFKPYIHKYRKFLLILFFHAENSYAVYEGPFSYSHSSYHETQLFPEIPQFNCVQQ